jgi:hypothetical protein
MADVQKLVQTINGDKVEVQAYCAIGNVLAQTDQAEQKRIPKRSKLLAPRPTASHNSLVLVAHGSWMQGWYAADITNDPRRGLGSWSVDDIANYLKTGHSPTSIATGLMCCTATTRDSVLLATCRR